MLKITTPSQRRVNVPLTHHVAMYDSSMRHVILDLDLIHPYTSLYILIHPYTSLYIRIHPYTSLYHEWMTWEGITDWKTCQERLLAPLLERCPVLLNRANWAQDFHEQGSSMYGPCDSNAEWIIHRIPGNLRALHVAETWWIMTIYHDLPEIYGIYSERSQFTSIYVTLEGQFSHLPFTIWHPSFEDQT